MRRVYTREVAGMVTALLFVTGCGTSGSGVPSAASAAGSAARGIGGGQTINLSGQYRGTVKDNMHGKGTGTATFAQNGSSLGGTLDSGSAVIADVAWTIDGTNVDGSSVIVTTSGYCTLSLTSTYNTKTFKLAGKYHAVHGCTGETGTFSLKQQCIYESSNENDIRPDNGPKPC
jgi:hypothetical protein